MPGCATCSSSPTTRTSKSIATSISDASWWRIDHRSGEVIGHLQLIPTDEPGVEEIKSLAVRAGFRRRGVGRALVERALATCRDEHAGAVTVTTAVADIDNIRFYQRCGFRASTIERDVFTPDAGYSPGLSAGGIPVRDAIRFDLSLDALGLAASGTEDR